MSDATPEGPSLIVVWNQESGGLTELLMDSFRRTLGLEAIGDIDPEGFFPLDGVTVRGDVIQFPTSRFHSCREANMVIFESNVPTRNQYDFLVSVLDFAVHRCRIAEMYTMGGVISAIPHTSPRQVFGIVNERDLKQVIAGCNVQTGMDYQTPSGGSTSLSNFLLWVAKTRSLPGGTLWVEVPFYLASVKDPMAARHMLTVLESRFGVSFDYQRVERELRELNQSIHALRAENTEVARCIELLERGIMLSEGESEALARDVAGHLRRMA